MRFNIPHNRLAASLDIYVSDHDLSWATPTLACLDHFDNDFG
jgi:hypothetical protein